ncbi:MAG: septum formation family protein [Acidimicrobiales bacterium]|nr:septum formation family protein [Acidimicrobiales bacterium]
MSDVPQGPGWWRASDGLYYPPEARSGSRRDGPGGQDGDQPPRDDSDPTAQGEDDDSEEPDAEASGDQMPADEGAGDQPVVEDATPPVVSDGAGGDGWVREPDDGTDRATSRRRRRWVVPVLVLIVLLVAVAAAVGAWFLLDLGEDDDDAGAPSTTETADGTDPTTTVEDTTTTTEDDGEVSAFDLGAGDCFDTTDVDSGEGLVVTTVMLVDCAEPHRAEVFGVERLATPLGEPFPGAEARDEDSQALCEPGFEQYVGVPLAESELVLLWLAPTEESWADDDREVACAVAAPDEQLLTESVEGSQR